MNNVKLLKIYFEEFSKYLSTDIDLILMTDLIESVNKELINNLKKEHEYEILKDILESMLVLSAQILLSKYFLGDTIFHYETPEKIDEKYNRLLCDYLSSIRMKAYLFKKLFDAIISSFENVKTIKANNKTINEIKKTLLPVFEKYKKEFRNNKN